ncbi:MAG TPA: D-aminoacyl-tRNA deacylase [candidate division Zixibacteria bacterium]|nr:D-aminoacyl-tRNA deacylase [candidate division Zixibacteria bacterium]
MVKERQKMRVLVQRVKNCEVWIDGKMTSSIGAGLLLFHGSKTGDSEKSCGLLAEKIVNLRIFEDNQEKMNLSALDTKAEIMIVSQFTLYADTHKGRRPAFTEAMEPKEAEKLYLKLIELVQVSGLKTAAGVFGAKMDIKLTNHGPVTIMLEHDV